MCALMYMWAPTQSSSSLLQLSVKRKGKRKRCMLSAGEATCLLAIQSTSIHPSYPFNLLAEAHLRLWSVQRVAKALCVCVCVICILWPTMPSQPPPPHACLTAALVGDRNMAAAPFYHAQLWLVFRSAFIKLTELKRKSRCGWDCVSWYKNTLGAKNTRHTIGTPDSWRDIHRAPA